MLNVDIDIFSLRIPTELNNELKQIAQRLGIGKNAIIITALWNYVKKESIKNENKKSL